ncbi:MAG: inner membrane protein YiaA [Flavobacteriales bacterium]
MQEENYSGRAAAVPKKTSSPFEMFRPSGAFIGASWFAFVVGVVAYNIGLWNADMELNEKGYYFTVLMFGLFAVVSIQKVVRDRLEGIPVSDIYYGASWFATLLSVLLLVIGLWNADLELSEKGFYSMSFVLSMFAVIAVQKNVRDRNAVQDVEKQENEE